MLQSGELLTSQPYLLAYRKDLLSNLSLPVPQTWDQLLEVCYGSGWAMRDRPSVYGERSDEDWMFRRFEGKAAVLGPAAGATGTRAGLA